MDQNNISYFVSFCIEQYKNAKHLTGEQAMAQLDQYGVLEYLANNYEILHTQSHHQSTTDTTMTQITQDNLYFLIPSKVSWLVDMLTEDTGMGVVDSIRHIYQSDMYRRLERENTKLWHAGPVALYEELQEE